MSTSRYPFAVALAAGLAVLLMTSVTRADRPKYRIRALVPCEGDRMVWARPEAINIQNIAAGDSEGPITRRATCWHVDETVVGLDYHAFPRSRAFAINNLNWVGGCSYYVWDNWVAAIWEPDGTCIPIGGLWQTYSGFAETQAINDLGVAVGTSTNDEVPSRAFRWTEETGMTDMGTLGGPLAGAYGINNLGQIVGASLNATNHNRAFLWEEGVFTELDVISGGTTAEALDINEQSQIVGASDTPPTGGGLHPVIWEPGDVQPADLGVPIPGGQAWAAAINNHGVIVGNATDPNGPSDYTEPWIWEDGVMTLLQELVPPDPTWDLYQVRDINDNGWIVGTSYGDGDRGFILIPLDDGDLDYDGDVDLADLAQLLAHYGTTSGATYTDGDLDEDGDVDLADLATLLAMYGTTSG